MTETTVKIQTFRLIIIGKCISRLFYLYAITIAYLPTQSLHPFSQNYNLVAHTTQVVSFNFIHEWSLLSELLPEYYRDRVRSIGCCLISLHTKYYIRGFLLLYLKNRTSMLYDGPSIGLNLNLAILMLCYSITNFSILLPLNIMKRIAFHFLFDRWANQKMYDDADFGQKYF